VFREARAGKTIRIQPAIRLVAASSLVFWVGAIIAGRLIAYLP
jgi:hypothetical protein